jgi:AhpD family alkylhydroperoxidase
MFLRTALASAALVAAATAWAPALAQQQAAVPSVAPAAGAADTYRDIEQTLGQVPTFMRAVPEVAIQGAWAEMKGLQMNPNTALNGKTKELIGLAVAAQIPCTYCVYFHTEAAKLNGATDEEIREAIGMAAVTRHWSTVLNGSQTDPAEFRKEADAIMDRARNQMAENPPASRAAR